MKFRSSAFQTMIDKTYEFFGQELDDFRLDVWEKAMEGFTDKQVSIALNHAFTTMTFMPMPAQIAEIIRENQAIQKPRVFLDQMRPTISPPSPFAKKIWSYAKQYGLEKAAEMIEQEKKLAIQKT